MYLRERGHAPLGAAGHPGARRRDPDIEARRGKARVGPSARFTPADIPDARQASSYLIPIEGHRYYDTRTETYVSRTGVERRLGRSLDAPVADRFAKFPSIISAIGESNVILIDTKRLDSATIHGQQVEFDAPPQPRTRRTSSIDRYIPQIAVQVGDARRLAELRAFIDLLGERYGVPFRWRTAGPYVADRQLVPEAQDDAGLSADFCLVAAV